MAIERPIKADLPGEKSDKGSSFNSTNSSDNDRPLNNDPKSKSDNSDEKKQEEDKSNPETNDGNRWITQLKKNEAKDTGKKEENSGTKVTSQKDDVAQAKALEDAKKIRDEVLAESQRKKEQERRDQETKEKEEKDRIEEDRRRNSGKKERILDPTIYYTIMVGPPEIGKTVILGSLIEHFNKIGKNITCFNQDESPDGYKLYKNLGRQIFKGQWPGRTREHDGNLEMYLMDHYLESRENKSYRFCLVDIPGEAWSAIDDPYKKFPEPIDLYFKDNRYQRKLIITINPYNAKSIRDSREVYKELVGKLQENGIAGLDRLFVVAQWDRVTDEKGKDYDVMDFLKDNLKAIHGEVINSRTGHDESYKEAVGFSVGKVYHDTNLIQEENCFEFQPVGIEEIWKFIRNTHEALKREQLRRFRHISFPDDVDDSMQDRVEEGKPSKFRQWLSSFGN